MPATDEHAAPSIEAPQIAPSDQPHRRHRSPAQGSSFVAGGTSVPLILLAVLAVSPLQALHTGGGARSIRGSLLANVLSIVTIALGLAAIAALAVMPALGRGDREAEEAARDYFDRHGRWPDEHEPG